MLPNNGRCRWPWLAVTGAAEITESRVALLSDGDACSDTLALNGEVFEIPALSVMPKAILKFTGAETH